MTEDFATPDPLDAEAPRPVVVVQYRRKGLLSRLAAPAVIMILALAVLSHRARIGDWRGLTELIGRREVAAIKPAAPSPPASTEIEAAPARPVVVRLVPATPPPPATQPPPRMLVSAFVMPSPLPIPLPAAAAVADSEAATARANESIHEEAARKKAELAKLDEIEDLKARQFAQDQGTEVRRRREKQANERLQADENRKAFDEDLRRILRRAARRTAADEIVALCEAQGVKLGADLRRIEVNLPEGYQGYTEFSRRARVEKCRELGMNEAKILDDLVRLGASNSNARNAATSLGDLIERAAKELIQVPVKDAPVVKSSPARTRLSQRRS